MLPLEGKTVISIEQAIAAPFCTRQLADLGARIIKIERPDGGDLARGYDKRVDGIASHFVWTNRGKESLTLDLKQEEGMQILKALLPKADIFVQNLAFGAAKRLGLDYENLIKYNPKMIVCDISGFGGGGSYQSKKAYDLIIQAESGLLSITGTEDELAKVPISIADICAGMYAYSAILSALLLLKKENKGSHIDISMLECMTEWMGYPLYYTYKDAKPPVRKGCFHASITPYGPYRVGEEGTVLFGLQNEREWEAFCKVVLKDESLIAHKDFSNNTLRTQNAESIKAIIEKTFETLSKEEVIKRLEKAKIANGQVNELSDVWQHPQLQARNRWRQVESEVGVLPTLLPPINNHNFESPMKKVPALGEHTYAILEELGMLEKYDVLKKQHII